MAQAELTYPYTTVEDYLRLESSSEIRHEFHDGVVEAMSGASKNHNLLTLNLAAALHAHLKGQPCIVYQENFKLHIKTDLTERYYYPDLIVDCSESEDQYATQSPKVLVEVLSPSTMHKDLIVKLGVYKEIPSVEEIVIIAQADLAVQVYRRKTNWVLETYNTITSTITLESLDFDIPITDLYERVDFS